MAFDGLGVFKRVRRWVDDATAGIKIKADLHDSEDDNFAAGITNCIAKDGQTVIIQNIPFNSKRITALADPIDAQDAATRAYADTKVAKTGSNIMGGPLVIKGNPPVLVLDDTGTGNGATIEGDKNGVGRWMMRLGDGSAESGGNSGSDFDLHRYADDGAHLGMPLFFSRASGLGTVSGDPLSPLGIATKQYADSRPDNRVLKAGDIMTGPLRTAESGPTINDTNFSNSLNVMGFPASGHAYMSFYTAGVFAANFGLLGDGNFYMAGGSHGSGRYKFWTTRDFTAVPTMDEIADLRARIEALENRLP